jgi:hypothetical protein
MGTPKEREIKNWRGVNLKDAADKVADNEVLAAQNCWQPSKGSFFNRYGSVIDQPAASFPLASAVSGVWRHNAANTQRTSLYHCVPNDSLLPDNTTDLVLTEVVDFLGNIFGGSFGVPLLVCYSWIGAGLEQTYNTKNRAGFSSLVFPIPSYLNTSHQTITLSETTSSFRLRSLLFLQGYGGRISLLRAEGAPIQQ